MVQNGFANRGKRFTARAADFSRALSVIVVEDVRMWDVFRWAVIVLLALNVLFLLSFLGGIRSEIDALKQEQRAGADRLTRVTQDIADTRGSLTQALSDTRSDLQGHIAKFNTKIDARLQQASTPSSPPAVSPKPSAKFRP